MYLIFFVFIVYSQNFERFFFVSYFHRGDGEGENEDFFEKFSSIRISYAASEKKRIQEFQFPTDEIDGELADQLWPTLGGWNVSQICYFYGLSFSWWWSLYFS